MNKRNHTLSRKITAILLTAAMFISFLPSGAFAEPGDETMINGGTAVVTDGDGQSNFNNDEGVSDASENESDVVTDPTEEGSQPPVENNAGTVNINDSMTQEEVDALVEGASTIVVSAGDYGLGEEKNHIKLTLSEGNQTVQLEENGTYHRLMIVVLSEGNILQANGATVDGDVSTVYNQSPMIYIPYGSLELEGTLSIVGHDYGVILGYTNAADESATLSLAENATLNITGCQSVNGNSSYDGGIVCKGEDYFSYVDTQGDGTRGSAIATKGKGNNHTSIVVGAQAVLNAENNTGAGVYSVNVRNFTLDVQSDASVNFNKNGQGICMNTDFSGSVNVNVDHAVLNIKENKSNGITGQNMPYVLNVENEAKVHVDDNGAIGVNNFFIKVDGTGSELSVSGNGSHGATNVALDVTNGAHAVFDNNAYIGLNITKYNEGKSSTDISDSIVQANNNGGPGIRFYVGGGETNVSNSKVFTNGNGGGENTYGYAVKPGDSGYWAGIVGKGKVTLTNSFITSTSAGGYSLYNDASAAAELYISGTDVVAFAGTESASNMDVFDDWNSQGNTGRTYVTGGSLQADSQNITKGFEQSLNQKIPEVDGTTDKEAVQYGAPINQYSTALTRFDLHQDRNTIVHQDVNTFNVSDPNGDEYEYTFRYNTDEEDLTGTGGNAYVWAPVTIIHYDATEGSINDFGTSQEGDKTIDSTRGDGSSLNNTPIGDDESFIDATDYTICGNSLALSEGTLPTASRMGLSFSGWYYAVGDDAKKAAEYAESENFEALYSLLQENGRQFDASTLTSDDNEDIENITLYAVWSKEKITITPADITVYTGGTGYDSVMTGEGEVATEADGLPTPGYLITLSESVNEKYFNGDSTAADLSGKIRFVYDGDGDGQYTTKDQDRVWNLAMYSEGQSQTAIGEDGIARYVYRMDADSLSGVPIRMLFSNDGEEIISDDFNISLENGLYRTYDMTIYSGLLNRDAIKAQVLVDSNEDGKYSEDEVVIDGLDVEVGTAKLTVRGTTNAEDIGAVGNDTDAVAENDHHITAVAADDTQYYINESQVEVDPAHVSLLSDALVETDPLKDYMVEHDIAENDENYEYRYLDLVDNTNGNAYVTATNPVDVYWALPEGADRDDDFRIVHFNELDREYDDLDAMLEGNEPVIYTLDDGLDVVTIAGETYLKFSTDSFSPFVLVWDENNEQPPVDPPSGGDDDTDTDEPNPDDTPDLNTKDHFSYIVGYPEDYRTGEPSENEDLWPVKPQGNITRAEVATIFYRLLTDEARDENWTRENNYTDVDEDDWFNTPVSTLSAMGIVGGYEDGSFRGNNPITRAEFAAIASRFFVETGFTYDPDTFTDVTGSEWFADALATAFEHGIIGGYPDGSFQPNKAIARSEACSIVNRTLDRIPHEDHLLPESVMRTWPDNHRGAWYYADMQEATNGHEYEWFKENGKNYEEWTDDLPEIDWDEVERELEASHGVR